MALPTLSTHWHGRARNVEQQLAQQHREQKAHWREQWHQHSQYFRDQSVRSSKQEQWNSKQCFQQSMIAYHHEHIKEKKKRSLDGRRERLRSLLQEERDTLEAELREIIPTKAELAARRMKMTESLRIEREERRQKLAKELLEENWRRTEPELRKVQSALHHEHLANHWQVQQSVKKQQAEADQKEQKHFENEYERSRQEALERLKEQEEKKREQGKQQGETLRQQIEELKLREEEAERLKKEQEALTSQRWEVEKLEEERKKQEDTRKEQELRCFLSRQYRAQLKRRAQQVQDELEVDRKILAELMKGEEVERQLASTRRERAVADIAWMKHVIEEQLQLEKQREAQFDILYREEAQRVWEKREAEWKRERKAREQLMQDVLKGRQQQLEQKMQENRQAQEESLRKREELIQQLEKDREASQLEREQEECHKTARLQDIKAQVEEWRTKRSEAQQKQEREDEEERENRLCHEEALQHEVDVMTQRGYQEKSHGRPRAAWT